MDEQQNRDWFKEYVEKELGRLGDTIEAMRKDLAALSVKVASSSELERDLRVVEVDLKAVTKQAHDPKSCDLDLTPIWDKVNKNSEGLAVLKANALMLGAIAGAAFSLVMGFIGTFKK